MPILIFLIILSVALYAGYRNYNTEYHRALRDSSPPFDEALILPLDLSEEELEKELLRLNYYRNLTPEGRTRFRERVRKYVEHTRIVSADQSPVSDAVRAFIAASAVQLTFGLRKWDLKHFHTIRIYPKEFYSRMNERYLKGGAGQNGVLWFSFKHYLSGYEAQEDGINLGLHEMSHALMINMEQGNQETDFNSAFEAMEEIGKVVMEKVRNGSVKFLRKYAGTNFYEFFAVSMEEFFERPAEFRRQLPELYKALALLVNQDPCQVKNDYRLSSLDEVLNTPVAIEYTEARPKKKLKNFRFARWHWSLTVLLIGAIIGPVSVIAIQTLVLISPAMLWAIYFTIVAGGGLFYYRRLVRTQALNMTVFVLFLLLGFAPLTLVGMIAVNRMVPIYEEVETYTLTGKTGYIRGGAPKAELVGSPYSDTPEVLGISWDDQRRVKAGRKLKMYFDRGLFWIRYHNRNEVVEK